MSKPTNQSTQIEKPQKLFIREPSAILVDYMGDDHSIIQAARMSFATLDKDYDHTKVKSLINYLARGMQSSDWQELVDTLSEGTECKVAANNLLRKIRHASIHWTPFAHTTIKILCKAPVPIRTQAFKHKQGLVENEESRRYITSTPEIYLPNFKQKPTGSIKQGSGDVHKENAYWRNVYKHQTMKALTVYEKMLEDGVCPEQARFVLPQGAMVNWLWTGNLYAFANYVGTRLDSHAQSDGYPLAKDIDKICRDLFPISWSALVDQ